MKQKQIYVSLLAFALLMTAAAAIPSVKAYNSGWVNYAFNNGYQPQFPQGQLQAQQFNANLWQRLCVNPYIASSNPNCSGGVKSPPPIIIPPIPPIPPTVPPGQYTSTSTQQCTNGFCTTCTNGVCTTSGTSNPPTTSTQQNSQQCVNGVCTTTTCINGVCTSTSDGNGNTK